MKIIEDGFPPEGIEVIVSNGEHYDIAFYIMSGEYKWLKEHIQNDVCEEFTSFIPTEWFLFPTLK